MPWVIEEPREEPYRFGGDEPTPPSTRLVANLNGITQYAKPSDIIVSGDYSLSITFENVVAIGSDEAVIIGNDTGTSLYIGLRSNGTFRFRTPRGGNQDVALPAELLGQMGKYELTVSFTGLAYIAQIGGITVASGNTVNTSDFTINAFGSYTTSIQAFFSGRLYDFSDSQGNVYGMGDGWPNNPVMANSGAGANGSWVNLTESSWEEIPA